MLLPISFIPRMSEQSRTIPIPSQSVQYKRSPEKVTPFPDKTSKASASFNSSLSSSSEYDSSDSDSDAGYVYVIPQRIAHQRLGKSRSLSPISGNDQRNSTISTTRSSFDVSNTYNPSTLNRNMSVRSLSVNYDFTAANPRRSIRQVRPLNRFGEWVSHQITHVYYV